MQEINAGELNTARQMPSPNFNHRPSDEISLVVIHCISLPAGHFGTRYIEHLFCNNMDCFEHPDFADLEGLKVASHLLIRRDGELIQFVNFMESAWHAGQSMFRGRTDCNDFSVGIELEGTDTTAFTEAQYGVLLPLLDLMCRTWSISSASIVGHSDIAPGRKQDPGTGFDWGRVRMALAAYDSNGVLGG